MPCPVSTSVLSNALASFFSMSLYLGSEIFDIYRQALQGEHSHLFVRQGMSQQTYVRRNCVLIVGPFHWAWFLWYLRLTINCGNWTHVIELALAYGNACVEDHVYQYSACIFHYGYLLLLIAITVSFNCVSFMLAYTSKVRCYAKGLSFLWCRPPPSSVKVNPTNTKHSEF